MRRHPIDRLRPHRGADTGDSLTKVDGTFELEPRTDIPADTGHDSDWAGRSFVTGVEVAAIDPVARAVRARRPQSGRPCFAGVGELGNGGCSASTCGLLGVMGADGDEDSAGRERSERRGERESRLGDIVGRQVMGDVDERRPGTGRQHRALGGSCVVVAGSEVGEKGNCRRHARILPRRCPA